MTWQIRENSAHLRLPGLEAAVNIAVPSDGLGQLRVNGGALSGSVFGLALPPDGQNVADNETEAYLRGDDLVATHSATQQWPFRAQVCWRAVHATLGLQTFGGVDLIASVQTQLLDSQPELSVTTCLPASQLLVLGGADDDLFDVVTPNGQQPITLAPTDGAGCLLYRFAADSGAPTFSYAEMIHQGDAGPTTLQQEPTGSLSLVRRIFSDRLEKGVILRTRLRGIFLEASGDAIAALAWYRAWLESELPLTA